MDNYDHRMNVVVLYAEWKNLINSFNYIDNFVINSYFNNVIVKNYSDRAYHNHNHVNSMLFYLRMFDKQLQVKDIVAMKFAIIFHDLVYQAGNYSNERKSAEQASSFIRTYIADEDLAHKVKTMILLTENHFTDVVITSDEKVFLDLDVAILAAEEKEYDTYVNNIMIEYQHVSRESYLDGRINFLSKLLDKKIFKTDFFSNFEEQAKNNIIRELEFLS